MSDESRAALARHNAAMRRQTRIYVVVLAVVAVLGAIAVSRIWVTGEVHNSVLHTVPTEPAAVAPAAPATSLSASWRSTDRVVLGRPLWDGTVVTYDDHTVRGRNARTGAQTWSYYRSNRLLCVAAQSNGVTMALYRVGGNCDELTALDSGTGERRWTRTLNKDGHPVNGTPIVAVNVYTLMVTTPEVIYAIDPGTGYDRWQYYADGCGIRSAVVGSAGALISQVCTSPDCGDERFCANGPQLLLRDAYAGREDKNSSRNKDGKNPNQVIWLKQGDTDVPVAADVVIAALNRTTRSLDLLSAADGADAGQLALAPPPRTVVGAMSVATSDAVLVWIDGVTYAVDSSHRIAWVRRSTGPPTVLTATATEFPASSATARISLTGLGAVLTATATTGAVTTRTGGVSVPARGSAFPVGSGFLVYAPRGCVLYQ
jgi:hypothetical protein